MNTKLKLDIDPSRKKILLRIENDIYEKIVKRADKEDKSITYLINEMLDYAVEVYEAYDDCR